MAGKENLFDGLTSFAKAEDDENNLRFNVEVQYNKEDGSIEEFKVLEGEVSLIHGKVSNMMFEGFFQTVNVEEVQGK